MRIIAVFLMLLCTESLHGISLGVNSKSDFVHFSEHFLASAALFTGTYYFSKEVLNTNKTESIVVAACTALMIGFLYKAQESVGEGYLSPNFVKSMGFNTIGVAVPAFAVWEFDIDF